MLEIELFVFYILGGDGAVNEIDNANKMIPKINFFIIFTFFKLII